MSTPTEARRSRPLQRPLPGGEALLLRMSSMRHKNPPAQIRGDLLDALPLLGDGIPGHPVPDVVAFTEITAGRRSPIRRALAEVAAAHGWLLWLPDTPDGALAVHPRHTLVDTGFLPVLDGNAFHGPRGLTWAEFTTPKGNTVRVGTDHNLTGSNLDRVPGLETLREQKRHRQNTAVGQWLVQAARGPAIGFLLRDTNEDEAKDTGFDPDGLHAVLTRMGVLSFQDTLGEYPATHGNRSIDVAFHHRGDRRVVPQGIHVWPKRRFSDHRLVDYRVWVNPPSPRTCPTCGQQWPQAAGEGSR